MPANISVTWKPASPPRIRNRSVLTSTIVAPARTRFFRGQAVSGRLRLEDLPDSGPWDASRIVYVDEHEI